MLVHDRQNMFVYAILAAIVGAVQSRAVNISNTWMLPEESFPVFYRYFRDRISWYEADAVCQFHHANLVTADNTRQYDAIRAYLKELDITEKVWIGLSKPQEKPDFIWSDFSKLTGEGHWQERLPAGDSQSLCAVMDPAADFLWRPLPCGGPEVAAFICELPIPSWAHGPKGCLLTELPSLTVLFIPELAALELTSDCGLDGTKRIACKGDADRDEMMRQLECVIPNDDLDDDKTGKSVTASSDIYESSTWDNDVDNSDSTTIGENEVTTRHRRETEDSLIPSTTRTSFIQISTARTATGQQKSNLNSFVTATTLSSTTPKNETQLPTSTTTPLPTKQQTAAKAEKLTEVVSTTKPIIQEITIPATSTSKSTELNKITTLAPEKSATSSTEKSKQESVDTSGIITTTGNVDDYPAVINQGQLFSIIENGTMFDIIELNETVQDPSTKLVATTTSTTSQKPAASSTTETASPTKKLYTKKPILPTKKAFLKKDTIVKRVLTTQQPVTTEHVQSVDELEESLTKEFEMMPDLKETVKLNRTFRKEVPAFIDEHSTLESGSQFGVPRSINFTASNALDSDEDEELQKDQPSQDGNMTDTVVIPADSDEFMTNFVSTPVSSVVKKNLPPILDDDDFIAVDIINKPPLASEMNKNEKLGHKFNVDDVPKKSDVMQDLKHSTEIPLIDPRLYVLNNHPNMPQNNHSESIVTTEKSKVSKKDFLPKSLQSENPESEQVPSTTIPETVDTKANVDTLTSEEPRKINRHRNLHNEKFGKKIYPYFFSRMLG